MAVVYSLPRIIEGRHMFKKLRWKLIDAWDGRFKWGAAADFGSIALNRFANNEILVGIHGPSLISPGTGHWPWYLFEVAFCTGPRSSWHINVLGFTIGKIVVNNYDQSTGEIVGPDKGKYYFFFKGINHKSKQLEEII